MWAVVLASSLAGLTSCKRGPTVEVRGEAASDRADALHRVEVDIDGRYSDVSHLGPDDLGELLKDGKPVLLFDVRTDDEFAVARLASAKRLAPEASLSDVEKVVGDDLSGATVVFYCSVGERSSQMARKTQAALRERGATVFNLRGGIFAWHNETRELVDGNGKTPLVHPYNDKWGQLLIHREKISTAPQP